MKARDMIKEVNFTKEITVELDKIYPIQPFDNEKLDVSYFIDDEAQNIFLGSYYANRLVIRSETETKAIIRLGHGYLTKEEPTWTNKFIHDGIWQGGDGIFSFNLEDGNDRFDQDKMKETLLVFGDSFVGNFDKETQKRVQPHLMPNNSIAYLNQDGIKFELNKGKFGNIKAFYELDPKFDIKGAVPRNLVTYDQNEKSLGYLTGYNPEKIELVFDLFKPRYVSYISFYNYYSEELSVLAKRGFKDIVLYGSFDNQDYELITKSSLEMANHIAFKQMVKIEKEYRYFKVICIPTNGVGNHNDKSFQEGLFGLNKVMFFNGDTPYKDVEVSSNTIINYEEEHAWIWLQDGVVIGNDLYFLPLTVTGDQTQPEGLQFKILGVSLYKTPIRNNKIITEETVQKMSPLYACDKDSTYFYGAGIMANTEQAGSLNPDGYVYIYGYKTTMGLRELIVSRVKAENFEFFDDWEYFSETGWQRDILKSKPILGHISCEMSVSEIQEGKYKGKYLAVFTYDVNTRYVSFAFGESPVGPFTAPQKVYRTPEQDIFKSTTYTYNAKAHPHLSKSKNILVSYNTNTYDFDHNMSNRLIYGPRFITLNEIEE